MNYSVALSDFILRFAIPNVAREGLCRVRLIVSPQLSTFALITDLGDKNTGSSVTNSIEHIRQALIDRGHTTADSTIIEHYEASGFDAPTFHLVKFEGGAPSWESLTLDQAAKMTSYPEEALVERITTNPRVVGEIERIRTQINPFADEPNSESPSVIVRREGIRNGMVPKATLQALVASGAIERQLQTLLKTDLSLLAEVYAHPEEEYIVFSEFPIADGTVDFALFSGRSRMDVTLIEIKGADFAILNADGYENFSAKLNEGGQQLRRRLGYIYRNYDEFRDFIHAIRDHVESGARQFNSFVGPYGNLAVDPNKDIALHYVLIGGRSNNDLRESKVRHDYELSFNPSIKVDSWDSWLKKLRRY